MDANGSLVASQLSNLLPYWHLIFLASSVICMRSLIMLVWCLMNIDYGTCRMPISASTICVSEDLIVAALRKANTLTLIPAGTFMPNWLTIFSSHFALSAGIAHLG